MLVDPSLNSAQDNYKLLTNLVIPRPIAWVTTKNKAGVINLAPYSFFNAVGSDPLYIVMGIGNKDDGSLKDTGTNIIATGEFVINLVTEDLLTAMNISAADFPSEEGELSAASLTEAPSKQVSVPRIAEAQVSLECILHSHQPLGANTLILGQVVMFYVMDSLVGDRFHIEGFAPIGRLGSPSMYCRTTDRFSEPRLSYDDWKKDIV